MLMVNKVGLRLVAVSCVLSLITVGTSAFAQAPQVKKPVIPHAQDKEPNEPRDAQTAAKMMTVPEGFSVEVVASEPDIVNPVAMAIDERGRFWITESLEYPRREPGVGKDRVKVLEDTDGDGRCDKFSIFLDGLNIPSGVAVGHGGVWIANAPDILFVPDADRDGKPDGPAQVVVTGFGRTDTHELPNSLTWGPDGWLYGLNGVFNYSHVKYSKENPNFKEDHKGWPLTCAMFRIHPRTREFQVFCEGTSNPWGIAFNDEGEAFVSACVIDHLWHLVETGYYHRQGGPYPPFTWKIDSIVKHKHQKAAYCGIHYFDSDAYPEKYRNKLYMGNIHGGCINVDRIERDGSTYKGFGEDDFLTANDAWFMPVVQKTGPDGCLYILDWYDRYHCYQDANRDPAGIDRLKGRLYRVRYNGKDVANAVRPEGARHTSLGQVSAANAAPGNKEATERSPERATQGTAQSTSAPNGSRAPSGQTAVALADIVQLANDNTAKSKRVYPHIDLAKEADEQLIERLGANNDFIRWTATRILQERATDSIKTALIRNVAAKDIPESVKRNSFFAFLGAHNARPDEKQLQEMYDVTVGHPRGPLPGMIPAVIRPDTSNVLRGWMIRAWFEQPQIRNAYAHAIKDIAAIWEMADGATEIERLQLVIGMGKSLKGATSRSLVMQLLDEGDRAADQVLIPRVLWQSLHPILEERPTVVTEWISDRRRTGGSIKNSQLLELMPRVADRILGRQKFDAKPVAELFSLLRDEQPQVAKQVIELLSAKVQSGELKGEKLDQLKAAMAEPLTPVLAEGSKHPLAADAALLAASWGDPRGLPQVRRAFATREVPTDVRLKSLNALISAKDAEVLAEVGRVLDQKSEMADFKAQILTAVARLEEPQVADVVLSRYASFDPSLQPAVVELLTQRASWSKKLLAQVADRKITAASINVNQARRMQALKDKDLNELLNRHWGQVRDTRNPDREKVVAEMKSLIRKTQGDAFAGEKVFKRVCAACHKIYNEGPEIGPDITLNGRNDFNQLLSNVFDPSLVIGAGYRVCTVVTKNGRVLSGLLVEDSPQRVVLKPAQLASGIGFQPVGNSGNGGTETKGAESKKDDGKKNDRQDAYPTVSVAVGALVTIPRDEIDEFKLNELSLMPEGLEKQLQSQEIVDLFAFLTLDKHPSDKTAKRLPGVTAVTPRQSTNSTDFPSLVAEILPGFSTNASGVDGVALLNNHFGRDSVLRTHPVSRDASCALSQKVTIPTDKKTKLILDVAHDPRGDWRLVVRGNGERMADEMISKETCKDGWRTLTVDLSKFAGTEMKLDLHNQANDWSYEFGYWGGARIVSE